MFLTSNRSSTYRNLLAVTLSLLLSLGACFILLRLWPEGVLTRLKAGWAWPPLFAYALISLFGALFRTLRYRHLLQPASTSFLPLFLVTLVRNFTVDLLPMRLGSLSFPALVHYRLHVPWRYTWSAYAWAIIWDFVSLAIYLWIALLLIPGSTPGYLWLTVLPLGLTFVSLALLFAPRQTLALFTFLIFKSRHRFPGRLIKHQLFLRRHFWHGLITVAETPVRTRFFLVLIESLLIRGAKYTSLYVLYLHFLKIADAAGSALSLSLFIWTLTFAEMTAALPIQGIMNIGPWELAWSYALKAFKAHQPSVSAVLSTLVHWTSQLWEYAIGALALGLVLLTKGSKSSSGEKA